MNPSAILSVRIVVELDSRQVSEIVKSEETLDALDLEGHVERIAVGRRKITAGE